MGSPYSTYDDRELIRRLRGSKSESEAAFTEIYDRYSSKIYAYCLRILGNKDNAEDIFQDTFYNFYKHVNQEHENLNIQRYLIKIARNLSLNFKRNHKATIPIEDLEFILESPANNDEAELQDLIKYAIELLEPEYREPLILRVYNGLQYDEIGEVCNISGGNARIRVFRAKDKLKMILNPYLQDLCK